MEHSEIFIEKIRWNVARVDMVIKHSHSHRWNTFIYSILFVCHALARMRVWVFRWCGARSVKWCLLFPFNMKINSRISQNCTHIYNCTPDWYLYCIHNSHRHILAWKRDTASVWVSYWLFFVCHLSYCYLCICYCISTLSSVVLRFSTNTISIYALFTTHTHLHLPFDWISFHFDTLTYCISHSTEWCWWWWLRW